jgi:hypothetical protein
MLSKYDTLAVVWIATAMAAIFVRNPSVLFFAVLATPPVLLMG